MPDNIFRHKQGGGAIRGIEGGIAADCELDRSSEIQGKTFVSFMSRIRNRSIVIDSHVSCSVIDDSLVTGSHVAFAKIVSSSVDKVIIRGTYDPANLENVILSGGVTVESCRLRNFELSGAYLLNSDFDREPRHHVLATEPGVRLFIVESAPGYANIGCKTRSIVEWIEKKELLRRIFIKRGWKGRGVDEIHELFLEWMR